MTRVVPGGPAATLSSPYDVTGLAMDAVVACARSVVDLAEARALALPDVGVDSRAVAAAVTSEKHLRIDGRSPAVWAPASGFFPAADGTVRLHGNYPHHAAAVARALGAGTTGPLSREEVAAAVLGRPAADVEAAVVSAGGVATVVRSESAWRQTEHGGAGGRTSERLSGTGRRALPPAQRRPADGLRVLDLTRVLAGPVAGRTLALWGADVLRIDPPDRPEIDWQHVDLDPGKRSTLLDLRSSAGATTFRNLAADADVVLLGYRPGALHALGLGGEDLLDLFGHLVVVELSAWGWEGPWSGRRGFDSIVQAAIGIAVGCADPDTGAPGALPAQVLDHATGYRAAAAALDGVRRRPTEGGRLVRLSLLGTGEQLLARGRNPAPEPVEPFHPGPYLATTGAVTYARPPFSMDGRAMDHPFPARPYGADPPVWLEP